MEDVTLVQKLVELLIGFNSATTFTEEDLASNITEEFLRNIKEVLKTKQIFIDQRWKAIFNKFPPKMLSSLETYLTYVIHACQEEASINFNVFERFLSVLCLLIYIIDETLKRTELNLSNIIPDIFMLLYKKDIIKAFCRRGGFRRFVDYINNPKYLEMRRITDCFDSSNAPFSDSLRKKIEKLQREETGLSTHFKLENAADNSNNCFWARTILKQVRIELLPFSRKASLKAVLYELKMAELNKEKEILKTELRVLEESLGWCSRLCPDSESHDEVRQMADKARFESIIEAVIKFNHSKSSDHLNKKNRMDQEKAEVILKDLTDKIMTLIEIVDEYESE